jgi:hypothetical protein
MMQEEASQPHSIDLEETVAATFREKLLARKGTVAYLPLVLVVILIFLGASWQLFWALTDAARYQCYALTFWMGGGAASLLPHIQCEFLPASTLAQPPFHALPLEYPPLALLIFTPALFAPLAYYQILFAVQMALVAAFIYWLLLRYGPRGSWLAFAFYLLIGAYGTAVSRFDLVPAALTLLCVIAAARKRWTYAYIALALGFLLKIYPVLLLPALFIAEQRAEGHLYTPQQHLTPASLPRELWNTLRGMQHWCWKNTLLFLGVIVGVTGAFALLDFQGAVLSQLSYFAGRPVQVESTGSILLFLATRFGYPVQIVYTFGSINMLSALGGPVALVFEALFALGYLFSIILHWRGRLDMPQTFIAILLVFIVTGKVFSPQYLIWLIPLLVYSGAYNRSWLMAWSLVSLLTTFIYPFLYILTPNGPDTPYIPGFVESVAVRNALLLALALAYLFNWFQARKSRDQSMIHRYIAER